MLETLRAGFAPKNLDYAEGWALQRRIHEGVVAGTRPDTLILCEHAPVYTAGTSARREEYPADGTPVIPVSRGGRVTWHGPGQLVGYPILTVAPLGIGGADVVGHVRRLEYVLIRAAAAFGVRGVRVPGRSGVWVAAASGGPGAFNKLAAIGIRVQNRVSLHGFALNCAEDLEAFSGIIPCGIRDAGVTSLSLAGGTPVSAEEAAAVIGEHFERWYTSPAALPDAAVSA